ncbi:uncharacterized protein LOC134763619 [Penaeus indicus]|uniref:uncharacterized protein LOC134763619 n=1 Tax=Penaeus indicus TaxID=29960 RepID=UPI00300D1BEB
MGAPSRKLRGGSSRDGIVGRRSPALYVTDKVPDKVKGKLHKLMVRPAMLYGLETVPLTKSQKREVEVAEMRMMRYEVGVTRSDKIKNETTREILGIERYGEKIRESRFSWFGNVGIRGMKNTCGRELRVG